MEDIKETTVRDAANGDERAFQEIYLHFSTFVFSISVRMMRNHTDAEEVTQEVFVQVYKSLKKFRFQSSLKTWVYRITVNTVINYCKKYNKERSRTEGYDETMNVQGVAPEMEQKSYKEEQEFKVKKILELLSSDQRAIVILREIEGMDYREIAETLDINLNTVRSRLKRAREKMMQYVKKGVI